MRKIAFEKRAFEDFTTWATTDKRIYQRTVALIFDILREPFSGLGKPEPFATRCRATGPAVSTTSIDWSIEWIRMQ